jgi:hypothetical protein
LREHAVEVGREGDRLAVTIEGHVWSRLLPRWFDREQTKKHGTADVTLRNFLARFYFSFVTKPNVTKGRKRTERNELEKQKAKSTTNPKA